MTVRIVMHACMHAIHADLTMTIHSLQLINVESLCYAKTLNCESACMTATCRIRACMRAGTAAGGISGRKDIVGQVHRRGTHAGNTHKHGDNGKQRVYAVQLSASPSYIYGTPLETNNRTVSKTERGAASDVESGTRPTNQGKS